MPEIGEIRAHAERVAAELEGRSLVGFRPLSFSILKTFNPDPNDAVGERFIGIRTRGKYLLLDFESISYVVHLMQGGRLRPDAKQAAKPRNGQARWTFEDGIAYLLTEAGSDKRAGIWVVPAGLPFDQIEPLQYLGPDFDSLSKGELAHLLSEQSMRLHGWLRRQSLIAGIGRRLANEICHEAMISPFAMTAKLTDEQIGRLHAAMAVSLERSLEFEHAQSEIVASAKRASLVHNRTGEPCPRCEEALREVVYNKYTVHYCAACQTAGKVLADNTTSKFLK